MLVHNPLTRPAISWQVVALGGFTQTCVAHRFDENGIFYLQIYHQNQPKTGEYAKFHSERNLTAERVLETLLFLRNILP